MAKIKYALSYDHNQHENAGEFTKWCENISSLNKDGFIPGKKFYNGTVKGKEYHVSAVGFRCSLIDYLKFVFKYKLKIDYIKEGIVFLSGNIHD